MTRLENIIKLFETSELNFLRKYSFENIEEKALLIIYLLVKRFEKKQEKEIAYLISELLTTVLSHWEGKDFLEMYIYERAIKYFPKSKDFLECILQFSLPPYKYNISKYIDTKECLYRLKKIDPENPLLNKF